jgi:peptidoglycan/LPS O-acetylase OafA/YrhL
VSITTVNTSRPTKPRRSPRARRSAARLTHLAFGAAIAAHVYLPPGDVRDGLQLGLAWVGVPVVVLSGAWLWKGATLRRVLRQRRFVEATP